MSQCVLIAEDNLQLNDMARNFLLKDGYNVYQAFDGAQAVEMVRKLRPDLLLLDLMLPVLSGEEVCRLVRMHNGTMPIIVISAKTGEDDKVSLLEMGADDYMTKPFSFKEMLSRVHAQLRRQATAAAVVSPDEDIELMPDECSAVIKGAAVMLSAKEYKMLECLVLNARHVMTKQKLIDLVWGVDYFIDENTVTVTVNRLREKLRRVDCDRITTVWGVGYKWQNEKN